MRLNTLKTISVILLITLSISCTIKNECNNEFEFYNSNDSFPVLNLDISKNPDSIRTEMCRLYGENLCEKCGWVNFRVPFSFEAKNGHLRIMAEFDSPRCENCGCRIALIENFSIFLNQRKMLLAEGELIEIDSLSFKIKEYMSKVGEDDFAPERFKDVNFLLYWNEKTNPSFLQKVITIIAKTHLEFVIQKLKKDGANFCEMKPPTLAALKKFFPLNIQFDLGNIKHVDAPSIFESIDNEASP